MPIIYRNTITTTSRLLVTSSSSLHIVDLHASKDHSGEQLIIDAWHCVGDGEELVRGLCSRGMLLFAEFKRRVLLFIVFNVSCYMLTQSLACFCNSSMVSNLCFNSSVSVFYDFHTHFCSLQQPMRETVGNKNKERVFCHTCCKKKNTVQFAMKDIFLYFLVRN